MHYSMADNAYRLGPIIIFVTAAAQRPCSSHQRHSHQYLAKNILSHNFFTF
jgi:hypothetical protein